MQEVQFHSYSVILFILLLRSTSETCHHFGTRVQLYLEPGRTQSVTKAHLLSVVSPCRLEESSAALCAQMERLEQEMEQEKKKQRMLEIKLRNSERAREDAENRNRLLEKEMEDFFSTLGDLALGSRTSDI